MVREGIDWCNIQLTLHGCSVQQNKVTAFGVHLVRAADAKRPREKEVIDLSSEDEMPRQLRWEEIKALYAERCGGEQIKKQTILLGHGTVKLRRTR